MALQTYPGGQAEDPQLVHERTGWIYVVQVVKDGVAHKVLVDAETGRLMGFDTKPGRKIKGVGKLLGKSAAKAKKTKRTKRYRTVKPKKPKLHRIVVRRNKRSKK